jgi:hypothetical protein
MTKAEILAAIADSPELQAMATAGNTQNIADVLSASRTKFVQTEVGNGTILEVLGLAKGNTLIDLINTEADFRHVKPLIEQGRLRLDSALVRTTLQTLVPSVLTQAEVDSLVARATVPDPVSHTDVGAALQGAN